MTVNVLAGLDWLMGAGRQTSFIPGWPGGGVLHFRPKATHMSFISSLLLCVPTELSILSLMTKCASNPLCNYTNNNDDVIL